MRTLKEYKKEKEELFLKTLHYQSKLRYLKKTNTNKSNKIIKKPLEPDIIQIEYGINDKNEYIHVKDSIPKYIYKCPICMQNIHRFKNKGTLCFKHIKKNITCKNNIFLKNTVIKEQI